jgi:predicted AlkP superfamily phosphohydrolase/phosphomutase
MSIIAADRRLLLLGLDGAAWSILDRLTEDGTMPFFRALVANSARAELRSTPVPVTPQAWTSVITGRSPGNHGIFDFVRADDRAGGFYFTLTNARDMRAETLWSILTRAGRRSIALNFPVMFPPRAFAGCSIPGFVPWRHVRRYCHPPQLFARLEDLPGFSARELAMDLDLEKKSVQGLGTDEREPWLRVHIRRERQWHDVLAELMRTERWDLAAVVFDGVDKLQHAFWPLLDPATAPDDTAADATVRVLCKRYFAQLDAALEDLVELAGEDARVLVVSDHGFGPTDEILHVNSWLREQGLLEWAAGTSEPVDSEELTVDRLKQHVGMLDWDRTVAYGLTPSCNGVFIRVARASGEPGIEPERYEAFRDELAAAMREIRDPATGEPVVTAATTRDEAYPGSCTAAAPDLTLTLRDHGFISVVPGEPWLRRRSQVQGTHRPDGVFVLAGPGVRAGVTLPRLSILDVAPTVLHALGEAVPDDFEGRVATEAFTDATMRAWPVQPGAPTEPVEEFPSSSAPPTGLHAEAAKEVFARLQALGYIEE